MHLACLVRPCVCVGQVLGIDFTQYQRYITVVPNNNCPWSGLASVGCGRNCPTWLKVRDPPASPRAFAVRVTRRAARRHQGPAAGSRLGTQP